MSGVHLLAIELLNLCCPASLILSTYTLPEYFR